jgi:2',3'-cyclic-nucleotide 2'-phosphodiesterase (5'-nucleotidase family)
MRLHRRKDRNNVLLLDAGDGMTGNPITDKTYRGAQVARSLR